VDAARIRQAMTVMLPKGHPEYGTMMQGLDLAEVAVFEVAPEIISVLDYGKAFGHTDPRAARGSKAGVIGNIMGRSVRRRPRPTPRIGCSVPPSACYKALPVFAQGSR
jgi:hypothetical protein